MSEITAPSERIEFKLGEFTGVWFGWSKHHEKVGLLVKREYEDGTANTVKDKELLATFKQFKNTESHVTVRNSVYRNGMEDDSQEVVDHYLILENTQRPERHNDYYSSGASNTKTSTKIRLHFRVEYVDVFLEVESHYIGSLSSTCLMIEQLEDIVDDIARNESKAFADKSITLEEDGYGVIGVDISQGYKTVDFTIEKSDFLDCLMGFEVIDQQITMLTKPSEEG